MGPTTLLKTYDDLCAMPDDGNRYELIDGEIVVSAAPSLDHQEVLARLNDRVRPHVHSLRLGQVLFAPVDVVFDIHNAVQPDLIYVSNARLHQLRGNRSEGPPDLVAEVASPSTKRRDLGDKLRLYARFGVLEYWFVDGSEAVFLGYRFVDGEPVPITHDDRTFRSLVLPELTIDLEALFAAFLFDDAL
jgi:Uma2 family endonuclease